MRTAPFLFLSLLFAASAAPCARADQAEMRSFVRERLVPGVTSRLVSAAPRRCEGAIYELTGLDPVTREPRTVRLSVHVASPATVPTHDVLIFPPTGGENPLDRGYAYDLCQGGARAVILRGWDHDTHHDLDLGTFDRASLRTLAAAEHTIEFLAPRGPVSVLGTSLGALGASFLLGYDARVATAVLLVGGDPLPSIIARTQEPNIAALRHAQMAHNGFRDEAEYEAALWRSVRLNPGTFAGSTGPKNVLMYMARDDEQVPTDAQWLLARELGATQVRTLTRGHIRAILATYLRQEEEVVSFLLGRRWRKFEGR